MTEYRRLLDANQVGTSGTVSTLIYGANEEGGDAGGYANAMVIGAAVSGSSDPANEVGGCVASLQIGVDGDERPVLATLWGSSYTLRGYPGVQPGGLMAYTAVVQNYFDGSGSRSCNYGYAAVTRPGIGDGGDFWNEPGVGFRYARTYPVDVGFVVCGDSGDYPHGGDVGYRVAFQAGGEASPWAESGDWRTRIGTGLLVRDWLETGVRVQAPHDDAGSTAPHILLEAPHPGGGSFLECRIDGLPEAVMAVHRDGRVRASPGREPGDAVTLAQLEAALGGIETPMSEVVIDDAEVKWRNDWAPIATSEPQLYRDGARAYLELAFAGGLPNTVALTLPEALRPERSVTLVGAAQAADDVNDLRPALITIDRAGGVEVAHPEGHGTIYASVSWKIAESHLTSADPLGSPDPDR